MKILLFVCLLFCFGCSTKEVKVDTIFDVCDKFCQVERQRVLSAEFTIEKAENGVIDSCICTRGHITKRVVTDRKLVIER
jgi:hypothetical protein